MKEPILSRFVALSSNPNNPAGLATYTYCDQSFEMPMPSFARAKELEQWVLHVVWNSRRQQRQAILAQMRGAINTVEGDSA